MEIKLIRDNFYSIEQGMVRCFLLLGEDEALLIDTGIKKGLKEKIKEVTNLPIKVLLTHSDGDHTTGNDEFDKIYMHPVELEYRSLPDVLPLEDDLVKLGDFELEVILIPGHTPGSIALLEKNQRFLIAGDSVSKATVYMFGKGRDINDWNNSLHKLKDRKDEFDVVYASHGEVEISPNQIDDCLELIDEAFKDNIIPTKAPNKFDSSVKVYSLKDKTASMYYTE